MIDMREEPTSNSRLVATIEPGVRRRRCRNAAAAGARLKAGEAEGYVRQNQLWGVYPDENF